MLVDDGYSFGVIQNNIALKRHVSSYNSVTGFGVIQNNIALKPLTKQLAQTALFWSHTKQHSSKTRKQYEREQRKVLESYKTT